MSIENPFQDNNIQENKPTSLLRTATLLSIIGSAVAMINTITVFLNAEKNYEQIKKMMNAEEIAKAPSFVKSMFNDQTLMMAQKMVENKLPMFIIGFLGAILCLFGAVFMRKLKKDGYFLWLTGELLPVLSSVVFMGSLAYSGIGKLNLLVPIVFIVIYTVCKKELIN